MAAEDLLAMQREFLAALREPLVGVSRQRAGLPPREAPLSEGFAATARTWLTPSAALDEQARLELYHRQYWYRLLESLADDFPGVELVLGRTELWLLLERYLAAHPPHTFSLRHLGAELSGFVERQPLPSACAVHVADLVRVEWAWIHAFEAAELPAAPAEQLGELALGLQPHLSLLACRTAADTLWRRANDARPRGKLAPATAQPSRFVAVYRDGELRDVERLHPAAFALLASLATDGSLERALEAAAPLLPVRRSSALVRGWFQSWTQRRWLVMR